MTVFGIADEPNPSGLPNVMLSAYRQIRFIVAADSVVPPDQPMYADIYFFDPSHSFYYKTITSYTIEDVGGTNSLFLFDIQDSVQEFLQTTLPDLAVIPLIMQTDSAAPYSEIGVRVKFRGSSFSSGLLVPEPVVPIQGTATTPPVNGTGFPCIEFFVLNSSIIPSWSTVYLNDLEALMTNNQVRDVTMLSDTRIYPLSNLPKTTYLLPNTIPSNRQWKGYNGGFPINILQFGTSGGLSRFFRNCQCYIEFGTNGHLVNFVNITAPKLLGTNTYYLPCGLADMAAALSGGTYGVLVDPNQNNYYRVGLFDLDSSTWCFHSPLFKVSTSAVESEILWFQNMYGHFEQVTFVRASEQFKAASNKMFVPYDQALGYGLLSPLQVGGKRYNVRANDEITLTANFPEQLMPWLKELMASPYVLHIVAGITVDFHAVTIVDGSFDTRKSVKDGRVNYEVSLKIVPAIEYAILRN